MDDLSSRDQTSDGAPPGVDRLVLGQRLRHLRTERGLTLAAVGERVQRSPSQLSKLEHGRVEPTLALLTALADALATDLTWLLDPRPPSRRAELEVALARIHDDPLHRGLDLPELRPSAALPDAAMEQIVGLFAELRRRSAIRARTPEEARQGNAALRARMRERDNHFADVEHAADAALRAVGYDGAGPLTRRAVDDLAAHFGFTIVTAADLPSSTRSLTDLRHRRIYVPERDATAPAASRSIVFQTLGHFVLEHSDPADFGEFLAQRVEANYFAGAMLVPQRAAAPLLRRAKADRELSIEDLADTFGVSYEMAAHRFTNLATRHLDIATHFVRSDAEGVIWKAYENDGVPFPADPDGAIEGQRLCRQWGTRRVFTPAGAATHHQYTDTPAGTYWCTTVRQAGRSGGDAVTVGVRFADALHFRGRTTTNRVESGCPSRPCCRRPPAPLAARWDAHVWPSPRPHSHVLAALPVGTFPGVDLTEAYEFVDRHAPG